MIKINSTIHGDCLEVMKDIDDHSIDMILCDLPYGVTACHWDSIIPLNHHIFINKKPVYKREYLDYDNYKSFDDFKSAVVHWDENNKPGLWQQYTRIIKTNGAIVLTGSQPFTTDLINSNRKWFKHDIIWQKDQSTGGFNANKMVLRTHESILIFYKKLPVYNPQKFDYRSSKLKIGQEVKYPDDSGGVYENNGIKDKNIWVEEGKRHPLSVIFCSNIIRNNNGKIAKSLHPTQKPVKLFEYLIETYSNKGDLILDNCAGSGTTGMAAINTERNYILIEQEHEYIKVINKRLDILGRI